MFYVILTVAMFTGPAQPGRMVVTQMDTSAPLAPIDATTVPIGARASYMPRRTVEQTLILFHCGAPISNDGITIKYDCQGM